MQKMDYSKLLGKIKEKGYTQKDVALLIGMSAAHMNRKLASVYPFTQGEILKICEALGIPPEEISHYFFSIAS